MATAGARRCAVAAGSCGDWEAGALTGPMATSRFRKGPQPLYTGEAVRGVPPSGLAIVVPKKTGRTVSAPPRPSAIATKPAVPSSRATSTTPPRASSMGTFSKATAVAQRTERLQLSGRKQHAFEEVAHVLCAAVTTGDIKSYPGQLANE